MVEAIKRGSKGRIVQLRAKRDDEWTPRKRGLFLDHLSATSNVEASARAAGMSPVSCYKLRRRDAAFADDWSAALKAGYQHLEAKLLEQALGDTEDTHVPADPDRVAKPFDPEAALRLLTQHARIAAQGRDPAKRTGARYVRAPIEQVEESVLRKLAAMARHLEKAS